MTPAVARRLSPVNLLLTLAVATAVPAAPARAAEDSSKAPVDADPGRILFGQTAQLAPPGSLRLTLHTWGLFQSASFVPIRNLEASVHGTPFPLMHGHALVTPMVRYRLPTLKWLQAAVGIGWGQEYKSIWDDADDPLGDYMPFPLAEASVTVLLSDFRFNICARYIMVLDRESESSEQTERGIDDVVLSIGAEWKASKRVRLFVEPTLLLPVDPVDDPDRYGPDKQENPWDYSDGAVNSLVLALGARFLTGRWALDVALVNTKWGENFGSALVCFTVSAVFELYQAGKTELSWQLSTHP